MKHKGHYMGRVRTGISSLVAALVLIFLIGCGQETVTIPDTTPPVVTSTTPVSNAVGVSLAQVVSATFSKPMNPSTISGTTFTLTGPGAVAVAGTVAYTSTGSVATFTPSASLSPGTLYTATITTGAQDTATPANALAANYVWSFTTVVVPPTVISTIPLSGATGVPLTQVISATFSKAMNPATLTNTTFTLSAGGVAIAGAVTYTGTTASFTPAVSLASNTVFTATITTGAQDVAGDALAANYVWTFTTVVVPPTVVSTIPLNGATAVPVAQVISATFSNGQTETVGQVAVATVANDEGLTVVSDNNFMTTAASGQATVGVAGTGSRGTITDSALELSNVDISTEFADLIVAQRAFEANSKTVTTFDTVTQDTIAMIR